MDGWINALNVDKVIRGVKAISYTPDQSCSLKHLTVQIMKCSPERWPDNKTDEVTVLSTTLKSELKTAGLAQRKK